jgi:AcrR family transcriptional regulator
VSTPHSDPIWAHPAPGSRKPRFSREQIAEIAVRIADQEGFDAVSMRRIADELDAGTMTLYHYVRTKEDLIALMDDAIMAEVLVPPEQLVRDWIASLGAIARSSYRAFVRHPWALSALRDARFGPNSMLHIEQSLTAVAHAPFDQQGKLDAIGIVDDYVFGHVYRGIEIARHGELLGQAPSEELVAFTRAQLATGAYPLLEAWAGDDIAGAWIRFAKQLNAAHRFELGLAALFDGLRRTLPRTKGRSRGRQRAPRASRRRG